MLVKGRILHTRDGSKCGNGIIREITSSRDWSNPEQSSKRIIPIYVVETDFGNLMKLSDEEIFIYYEASEHVSEYDRWFFDRLDCISRAQSGAPSRIASEDHIRDRAGKPL
jgi:hypothetical protein